MFTVLAKREGAHDESIWTCSWSRPPEDGQDYILTGSLDSTLKVWQWLGSELRLHHTLDAHNLAVISVDSRLDGSVAVSSSIDCCINAWDIPSGSSLLDRPIQEGPVDAWTVALSPDSNLFATGSQSGKLSIYNMEKPQERESALDTGGKFVLSVCFSPDGRLLAGSSMEGMVYIFDLESASLLYTMEGHALPIRSMVFSPDSKMLITASDDKYMKVHDLSASSSLVGTMPGHSSWVLSVDVSPDGRHLASSSADNTVKIWDFASRQSLHTFSEHNEQVWSVRFNPSGDRLVSVSDDKDINVYSVSV